MINGNVSLSIISGFMQTHTTHFGLPLDIPYVYTSNTQMWPESNFITF